MIDLDRMSPDEIIELARTRKERRARGEPLDGTHAEVAARVKEDDDRLEKEIQAECRKIYIAFGCTVWSTSQSRASKVSAGIPDLLLMHERLGLMWWMELKTPRGVQSPAQSYFEQACRKCGVDYLIGGVRAAEEKLVAIGAAHRDNAGNLEPTPR